MPLNRRKEREIVFRMLFAASFSPEEETAELYERLTLEWEADGARESAYIKKVFCGARDFAPEAAEKIAAAAQGWKLERLSRATRALLTLALYEMERVEDVPERIAINEAVELAKKYGEDGAKKFINGILGTLSQKS